jgi:hypothetical protein
MATPVLPPDFREFLQLLNATGVEYLVVGGYAVGYHGYVGATADMDVGVPPLRIEVFTGISGVQFEECFADRLQDTLDGIPVNIINLRHLRVNKQASGRAKT